MPEKGEWQRHLERLKRPYSFGHRMMYEAVTSLLAHNPADIIEIGVGIGYGLQRLLGEGCVKRYVGYEPDAECCTNVTVELKERQLAGSCAIELRNLSWPQHGLSEVYDFGVCIETLEHLTADVQFDAVQQLVRIVTRNLFISTPDPTHQQRHGHMRTAAEWKQMFYLAGCTGVVGVSWQWTTFYLCDTR